MVYRRFLSGRALQTRGPRPAAREVGACWDAGAACTHCPPAQCSPGDHSKGMDLLLLREKDWAV